MSTKVKVDPEVSEILPSIYQKGAPANYGGLGEFFRPRSRPVIPVAIVAAAEYTFHFPSVKEDFRTGNYYSRMSLIGLALRK